MMKAEDLAALLSGELGDDWSAQPLSADQVGVSYWVPLDDGMCMLSWTVTASSASVVPQMITELRKEAAANRAWLSGRDDDSDR